MAITLKCQCCGIEREFTDGDEAFAEGWDAPPHFSQYICCELCPAVCIILGESHDIAHARWREKGRPADFSVAECGTDNDLK